VFRKLIISLFIFTSLSGQVSAAFACKMTGAVMAQHCCPDNDGARPEKNADTCCRQIFVVSDHDGTSTSVKAVQLPLPDFQPQLLLLVSLEPLFASSPSPARWADPPDADADRGSLTYLHTQRLRI
jgi:hypothetical protein